MDRDRAAEAIKAYEAAAEAWRALPPPLRGQSLGLRLATEAEWLRRQTGSPGDPVDEEPDEDELDADDG